ncbi:DUF4177 domain-containing protein [Halocatena marina]|uniref:DUF4177 domain-containing protein n=1 Tax=Halocatena marina TaxID=2934937 RepID=A0ABD5YKJ1_9EURY|nr:DUF4177 domain-containing protein [Halocatena marina]
MEKSEPTDSSWEYTTLRPPRGDTKKEAEDPTDEMNELAAKGWRLIETIDYTGGGTKFLVFERPASSAADRSQNKRQS